MKIKYYGHSCFTINADGFTIVLDPFNPDVRGYEPLFVTANAVYCSHKHGDHAYTDAVSIEDGRENPFRLTEIPSFHDDANGTMRGPNMIRVFEAEGKKVAHLGDLGCGLNEGQVEILKGVDVLLIPVGGYYTIDWHKANEIVGQLQPKMAIPMHFRDGKYGYEVIEDISNMKLGNSYRRMTFGEEIEI